MRLRRIGTCHGTRHIDAMSDATLRVSIFLGLFALFATLEVLVPRRPSPMGRLARWPGAGLLLLIGSVLARFILPAGLAGVALWADMAGFGLLNQMVLPDGLAVLLAMVMMDFLIWGQHVVLHLWPPLWRLHRVHHSDPHLDVATALRFHPGEIVLSLVYKGAIVALLGVPPVAAFWFEVILNGFAQFNHANWRLPLWADRMLRLVVVTPDFHRVHHSVDQAESDRNFGFCLSIWDRIFRFYTAQPSAGHDAMTIGQDRWRTRNDQRLDKLVVQPVDKI